jgi:hypothetical protein
MCASRRTIGINEPSRGSSFAGSAKESVSRWSVTCLETRACERTVVSYPIPVNRVRQQAPPSPFQLLSDEGDDGEEIIIPVDDDDISPISLSSSSSPIYASINTNHNQEENATMTMNKKQQEEEEKKKDRKVRVISFRLSEREYARHLAMAKLCYENGLTKGPDIVSYIRLSMECLSRAKRLNMSN